MAERTCLYCNAPVTGRRIQCGADTCRKAHNNATQKRNSAAHKARTGISYTQKARPATITPCGRCGKPLSRGVRTSKPVCRDCSHAPRLGPPKPRRPPRAKIIRPPQPGPSSRIDVSICCICGRCFCARSRGQRITTCSPACGLAKKRSDRRQAKQRRRAVQRNAFVANVSPRKIYERDRWKCQLCGKAIRRTAVAPHPLAPTIDHVVPLAAGGTHEPANCQAAHFICNCLKSDGGEPQQLRLLG